MWSRGRVATPRDGVATGLATGCNAVTSGVTTSRYVRYGSLRAPAPRSGAGALATPREGLRGVREWLLTRSFGMAAGRR